MEFEGIPVEALADPSLYRRPVEEEESENVGQTYLESKQNRAANLRDNTLRIKPKRSKCHKRSHLHSFYIQYSFHTRRWSKFCYT